MVRSQDLRIKPPNLRWVCLGATVFVGVSIASRITAAGIVQCHAIFATRITSIPFLFMFGIRRIDVATLMGLLIVGCSYMFLEKVVSDLILNDPLCDPRFRFREHSKFIRCVGCGLVGLDVIFFWFGLLSIDSWTGTSNRLGATLLAAMYLFLMCGLAYINIWVSLRERYEQ
jgi:hypothetical protein